MNALLDRRFAAACCLVLAAAAAARADVIVIDPGAGSGAPALNAALDGLQGPLVIGVLPAPDGQFSVPFTLPHLPPGVENVTVLVQGLFKDAGGSSQGGASALTWIDEAF